MNAAEFYKHALTLTFRSPGFVPPAPAGNRRTRMGMMSHRLFVSLAAAILTMIAASAMPSASAAQANQAASRTIPPSVEAQLDTHIKRYIDWYEAANCEQEPGSTCRGIEYREGRSFCFGDINGDGKEDIAVLYTLEGFCCGNNYEYYLAVFLNSASGFELVTSTEVGGKGERTVEFDRIKDGKIVLNTDEYLDGDPMCCPSGKGATAYSLKDGKLVESGRTGEKPAAP